MLEIKIDSRLTAARDRYYFSFAPTYSFPLLFVLSLDIRKSVTIFVFVCFDPLSPSLNFLVMSGIVPVFLG